MKRAIGIVLLLLTATGLAQPKVDVAAALSSVAVSSAEKRTDLSPGEADALCDRVATIVRSQLRGRVLASPACRSSAACASEAIDPFAFQGQRMA